MHRLTDTLAIQNARLAIESIRREYPNAPGHLLGSADDLRAPPKLHPALAALVEAGPMTAILASASAPGSTASCRPCRARYWSRRSSPIGPIRRRSTSTG
jgi:hypothetical protein